jgi:hypothetical protein
MQNEKEKFKKDVIERLVGCPRSHDWLCREAKRSSRPYKTGNECFFAL